MFIGIRENVPPALFGIETVVAEFHESETLGVALLMAPFLIVATQLLIFINQLQEFTFGHIYLTASVEELLH